MDQEAPRPKAGSSEALARRRTGVFSILRPLPSESWLQRPIPAPTNPIVEERRTIVSYAGR
jgi:hypothetical protein